MQIPAGSKVEIRLIDKQKLKRRIAFTEMASIKKARWGIGRWALVGFGVLVLVIVIAARAGAFSN